MKSKYLGAKRRGKSVILLIVALPEARSKELFDFATIRPDIQRI